MARRNDCWFAVSFDGCVQVCCSKGNIPFPRSMVPLSLEGNFGNWKSCRYKSSGVVNTLDNYCVKIDARSKEFLDP